MLRKKLPRNWRIKETLLSRGKRSKTTKVGRMYFEAWSGITYCESITASSSNQVRRLQEGLEFIEDSRIFRDPDSPSSSSSAHVPHQAHITSSSRKPSRELRMQRNTRDDMGIPGNVFDRQSARRDPDELHNTSKNLATSSGILTREGIEKWERRSISINTFTLFSGKSNGKESRRQKLSYVFEKTLLLVLGLVLTVAWQYGDTLPRRCIWENSLTIRNFRAGLWTSEQKFCSKTKNPMEKTPEETSRQEDCARKVARDLAKKYVSSKPMIKLRFILLWK